jgi:hypothetical protein
MSGEARPDGSLSLREASKAYAKIHNEEYGRDLNEKWLGHQKLSPEYAAEIGEYTTQLGRAASEIGPKERMGLVDNRGKVVEPIGDGDSIKRHMRQFEEAPISLKDSAEWLGNFRRENERIKQEMADKIKSEIQTQDAEAEQVQAALAQPTQPAQSQPATQTQQPDPHAQERARLQQEYARVAAYREHAQMTSQERQYEEAVQRLDAWANSQPELMDHNLFQNLVNRAQKGDVAAANRLKGFQKAFAAKKAYVQKFVEVNTARVNRQIALEQYQAQQNAQVAEAQRAQHNKAFDTWLEQTHPTYAKGDSNRALKAAAKEILRERGFTDEAISQLRPSALEQSVLADAAILRIGRARAKEIQRQPLPPVQRPGVARSRYADVEDVKTLQRKVSGARSQREALMAAVELQQARRRGG